MRACRRNDFKCPWLVGGLLLLPLVLLLIQVVLFKHSLLPHPQATFLDVTDEDINKLLDKAESDNKLRIERVRNVCKRYNLGPGIPTTRSSIKHPPTPQYGVFYIDLADSLAYCPIYKAASTTWLYNMCLLSGLTEQEMAEKSKHQQLSTIARELYPELDFELAKEAVERATKLLVVRHPMERLLSAYRDKLENSNLGFEHGTKHFYRKYGVKIVRKYRGGGVSDLMEGTYLPPPPGQPRPSGLEPTFQEFVKYIIDTDLLNYPDDHWIPYYLFCTPCLLEYDFIAKVETLDRDQAYVIRRAGLEGRIKPRWKHQTKSRTSKASAVYFKQLTRQQVLALHEKYRLDFELFDYDLKPYLEYASS